ncbi:MAG: thioesterase family protein [Bacteroidales bacterium]
MLPVTHRTTYRVTYGDTDQMGVVYYGNYARLYEIGRTEMIRAMGMPYRELEEEGVMMPVYTVESRFRDVILYDELVTIETTVEKLPAARMEFGHRIFNQAGKEVHVAMVVLVFMDIKTRRPVRAPEKLIRLLQG